MTVSTSPLYLFPWLCQPQISVFLVCDFTSDKMQNAHFSGSGIFALDGGRGVDPEFEGWALVHTFQKLAIWNTRTSWPGSRHNFSKYNDRKWNKRGNSLGCGLTLVQIPRVSQTPITKHLKVFLEAIKPYSHLRGFFSQRENFLAISRKCEDTWWFLAKH